MATDAGRPVYAIPGPIDRPQSEGCHELIRNGATLVTKPEHILTDFQELPLLSRDPHSNQKPLPKKSPLAEREQPKPQLTETEATIYQKLEGSELTIDRIAELANLPVHIVSATLLGMEMKGLVTQRAGQKYLRRFN